MTGENDLKIECSNCEAPLAEVWVHKPEIDRKTKIKIHCGHCGDWSFEKNVNGEFYLGGTQYSGIESIEEKNAEYNATNIVKQDIEVLTVKVKEYE